MYGWGWNGDGAGLIGMTIMMIFWLAIVVGIVFLVAWLVRQSGQTGHTGGTAAGPEGSHETPLDIIKSRYARGEIDKAEFEEKKKDLA